MSPSERDAYSSENPLDQVTPKDKGLWRDLVAYWILGLCNNYGYVVMLSAAHDILSTNFGEEDQHPSDDGTHDPTKRQCNYISTGAILLADILPALAIKFSAPFLPFYIHIRILCCCILAAAGFLLVAFAPAEWVAILGVVSTSLSSGLGEVTFLSYSSVFNKNVISTWSSGTGGAGVIGAISYAGLTSLGLNAVNTLLVMLVVPAIEAFTFWVILRHPPRSGRASISHIVDKSTDSISEKDNPKTSIDVDPVANDSEAPLLGFKNKLRAIPPLFVYMIPLLAVYFLEYFINQGLFELIYFDDSTLSKEEQYRWLQVDYQIGVFISRSSVNIIQFKHVWLMSVFQFFNVLILLFEVIYSYVPNIWIVLALVLWEGLLGGGAYVNTFYRMSHEIPSDRKEFSMGITSLADSIGIALAGAAAIPAHNALCGLPLIPR